MASEQWRLARAAVSMLALALVAPAPSASFAAGAPVDTFSFEDFNLGPLAGQQGWVGVDGSGGQANVNGAVVQSAVAFAGSKAVRVSRAAGVDNWWAVPRSPLEPMLPSNRFLLVDWEMLVESTGFTDGRVGPYFGVETYDAIGVFGRVGSLGVDATTSDVMYLKKDPAGAILEPVPSTLVDLGAWNHFAMLFDFTAGQYSIFLNEQHLLTTPFADPGVNQFTDADITGYAAAADANSQLLPGTAYFDNFRVLDGIPGDFQVDGDVDGADLPLWRTAFHNTAVGDADGDDDSDGHDFLIWQYNLGTDYVPAAAAGTAAPEPAAAVLAALGLSVAIGWRRRQS